MHYAHQKMIPAWPFERLPRQPSTANGWSVGGARSASKIPRLQALQDSARAGVSMVVAYS